MAKQLPAAPGHRSDLTSPHGAERFKADALEKAGVSSHQASKWERLAEVPEKDSDAALAAAGRGWGSDGPQKEPPLRAWRGGFKVGSGFTSHITRGARDAQFDASLVLEIPVRTDSRPIGAYQQLLVSKSSGLR